MKVEIKNHTKTSLSTTGRHCFDHEGNAFATAKAKCEYWGVDTGTYCRRISTGWTEEQALTGYKPYFDHEGNPFETIEAKCEHWGVKKTTYYKRLKSGWTEEQALTGCAPKTARCFDHEGNAFETAKAKCKHWGVDTGTYCRRISTGWTEEQALTGYKPYFDHEGNAFETIEAKCEHWGVKTVTYYKRLRSGWTEEQALTAELDMSFGEYCVKEQLDKMGVEYIYNKTIEYICNVFGLDVDTFAKNYAKALREAGCTIGLKRITATDVKKWRFDFTTKNGQIIGFIEVDGDQHFTFVEYFFKTLREFFRRCDVDQAKTGFAFYNEFPLLRLNPEQYRNQDTLRYCLTHFFNNPEFYTNGRINPLLTNEEYYAGLREAYPEYVPANICETMSSLTIA